MISINRGIWTLDAKARLYTSSALRKDVMIDIETTGKRAGCAVLTLGATVFDPRGMYSTTPQSITLDNQFMARISLDSCKAAGLTVDQRTMEWWGDQSKEAVDEAFGGTATLTETLTAFTKWLYAVAPGDKEPNVNIWSHGEDFDIPILGHAYEALHMEKPWPYNAGRDTRTVFDMADTTYKGVHHMALQDAMAQAQAVRLAFYTLGLTTGFRPTPVEAA